MYAADSYEHIMEYLPKRWKGKPHMCGLLFAPPETDIGKSIFARIMDWHYRSGENFDFFCVGYGNWSENMDQKPIATITRGRGLTPIDFYYNPKAYNDIRIKVEKLSGYQSSGEVDLLLVNVVIDPSTEQPKLDFEDMVALDVDLLIREKVFPSCSRLLERICRAADKAVAEGNAIYVTQFSDRQFLRTFLQGAMRKVIETLKIDTILGARHFIVGAHLIHTL